MLGSVNEGNCGFGPSTNQLCSFCRGSTPDACCYACKWGIVESHAGWYFRQVELDKTFTANTDLTTCGFILPPQASSSSAAPSSTSTSSSSSPTGVSTQQNAKSGLSGGQIAGIVVGSVVGGLLVSLCGSVDGLTWAMYAYPSLNPAHRSPHSPPIILRLSHDRFCCSSTSSSSILRIPFHLRPAHGGCINSRFRTSCNV